MRTSSVVINVVVVFDTAQFQTAACHLSRGASQSQPITRIGEDRGIHQWSLRALGNSIQVVIALRGKVVGQPVEGNRSLHSGAAEGASPMNFPVPKTPVGGGGRTPSVSS